MRLKFFGVVFVAAFLMLACMTTGAAHGRVQTQTVVRAVVGEVTAEHRVTIAVEVGALGIENALGASLIYDPAELSYVGFSNPSPYPGAVFFLNTLRQAEGRIGFLYGMPAGRTFSVGAAQVLRFTFALLKPGKLELSFGDIPVVREVVNVRGQVVESDFRGDTVETPWPSIGTFYAGPTRGVGPIYVIAGGLTGAERGLIVAYNDNVRGSVPVAEIFPGEYKRFVFYPQSGITYFRVVPFVGDMQWGYILYTAAALRK